MCVVCVNVQVGSPTRIPNLFLGDSGRGGSGFLI